jgi:hypothetical protein
MKLIAKPGKKTGVPLAITTVIIRAIVLYLAKRCKYPYMSGTHHALSL